MTKQVEVHVVGSFPNPYGKGPAGRKAKIEAIERRSFSPDVDDFSAVVHAVRATSIEVHDALELLGTIACKNRGTIRRLNIITHGNPTEVALAGTLELSKSGAPGIPPTVKWSQAPNSVLTSTTIQRMASLGPSTARCREGPERQFTAADIKSRFTKDGVVVLYSCESGSSKGGAPSRVYLKELAGLFGTKVIGFSAAIAYCVNTRGGTLKYSVGVGSCEPSQTVADFRTLIDKARAAGRLVEAVP